jgi:hypothetical protein
VYNVLGFQMDGVGIWIAFKVALIMPLSGIYAWYLTRLMQRYRLPDDPASLEEEREVVAAVARVPSAEVGVPRPANAADRLSPNAKGPDHGREAKLG